MRSLKSATPVLLAIVSLFLGTGGAVPLTCVPAGELWTPLDVQEDATTGLRYRAEVRRYRCRTIGKVDYVTEERRDLFLDLPSGVWVLRYPSDSLWIVFVTSEVSEAGRRFATDFLRKHGADLLLLQEGVKLPEDALSRVSQVLRLAQGEQVLKIGGKRLPLWRLKTLFNEFDY